MPEQPNNLTINDVVASLIRRGFASDELGTPMEVTIQVMAVLEELGEVARHLRRFFQGVAPTLDPVVVPQESIDVMIAAICLANRANGDRLSGHVALKLEMDEQRGWRHSHHNVQALAAEAARLRREDEAQAPSVEAQLAHIAKLYQLYRDTSIARPYDGDVNLAAYLDWKDAAQALEVKV